MNEFILHPNFLCEGEYEIYLSCLYALWADMRLNETSKSDRYCRLEGIYCMVTRHGNQ